MFDDFGVNAESRVYPNEAARSTDNSNQRIAAQASDAVKGLHAAAPLISISISFWNDAKTLPAAITSVINQSFRDWELLLIDDGSTDESLNVARGFVDDRITLIAGRRNKGLVSRLNEAIARSTGKYYARMDADDVMHEDRLLRQVEYLESHPDVDVVDTAMYVINERSSLTGIRANLPPKAWTLRDILLGRPLHHATVLGRMEWFRAHPYDPAYIRAEDFELWCRTVENSVFGRLMEPLYFVREGRRNAKAYRRSQATSRRIFRTYGSRCLTRIERERLCVKSMLKSLVYTGANWSGLQNALTRLRNVTLDPRSRVAAEESLQRAITRR